MDGISRRDEEQAKETEVEGVEEGGVEDVEELGG